MATRRSQSGFSYVEMLIGCLIVMASLGPAIDAVSSASRGAAVHLDETRRQLAVQTRTEQLLAEPFGKLRDAASAAGTRTVPTSYSDPATKADAIEVYLWVYDVANKDGDGISWTIADVDEDDNPFAVPGIEIEMLWVRVAMVGSVHSIESLVRK